jgi:hypothetical protein
VLVDLRKSMPVAARLRSLFFGRWLQDGKIATQGNNWAVLEHFKDYFAPAAGTTSGPSSSASWAETDLDRYMRQAAANAPLFIEAFYDGCKNLKDENEDLAVPDIGMINRLLAKHGVAYDIRPPLLLRRGFQNTAIPVPEKVPSLEEQAQELIQSSLSDAEALLSEHRYRQAVQELLWLPETVSTAFQGLDAGRGTVQGKYFNKIVGDLRRYRPGTTLDQVLSWMTTLHGYLSSPTGGGIRHGADLKAGIATKADEARLYCNLIRNYIMFLLSEHARLSKNQTSDQFWKTGQISGMTRAQLPAMRG